MQLKQCVYNTCLQLLNNKIQALQNILRQLSEGAISDGKSSAGDKHETARAMMQLEQEKISKQLDEMLIQKETLLKIDSALKSEQITKGSLVKTNKGYLFVSVALGKISVEGIDVIALSTQSPLGVKLMGLTETSSITINEITYSVEEIS